MPNTEPITPEKLRETAKILDEAPWGGSVPAEENAVGDLLAAADEIEVLRRRDKVLRYIDEHSRTRQPCAGSSTDKGFLWEIDLRVFDDRPRSDMHLTVSGSVGQLMDEEEAASGPPQG